MGGEHLVEANETFTVAIRRCRALLAVIKDDTNGVDSYIQLNGKTTTTTGAIFSPMTSVYTGTRVKTV